MQNTIERTIRASREQQRHEEFDLKRRLTDELTEASEKLAMVMNNSFEFEMRDDGELYFQDGSVGEVLRNSVLAAEKIVTYNPQFITELIRRRIELQEYDDQRRLSLGSDTDPDVLVVLSPIPDAVVVGVDLGAYDTDRRKTLARIYTRTEKGILSTSISLDRSDRAGLQAVARQFGQTIRDDDGSEDILAMRFWGYSSVLNDPIKTVRRRYDEQLERQHGGQWYGGRQDGEVMDALGFIKQQPDIIAAHMYRMKQIEGLPTAQRGAARKIARYDFAATLDKRRKGETAVGDGVDLAGSGDGARAEGKEYKSDCPTGSEAQTQTTAQEAVKRLYEKSEERAMTCPFCGLTTYGDPCAFRLVCGRCAAEVRGGKIISTGIGRKAVFEREAHEKQQVEAKAEKQEEVARKIAEVAIPIVFESRGKYYENTAMIGIGGMIQQIREVSRTEWVRRRNDYELAA